MYLTPDLTFYIPIISEFVSFIRTSLPSESPSSSTQPSQSPTTECPKITSSRYQFNDSNELRSAVVQYISQGCRTYGSCPAITQYGEVSCLRFLFYTFPDSQNVTFQSRLQIGMFPVWHISMVYSKRVNLMNHFAIGIQVCQVMNRQSSPPQTTHWDIFIQDLWHLCTACSLTIGSSISHYLILTPPML